MTSITKVLIRTGSAVHRFRQKRAISALYVTGDKASENYVVLRPYMDFEDTLRDTERLQENLDQRQMPINVAELMDKYSSYLKGHHRIQQLEKERESNVAIIKNLLKTGDDATKSATLKAKGKNLKIELKKLKEEFYAIDDDFVHRYLELPNQLHAQCPRGQHERIIYRSQVPAATTATTPSHMQRRDLIRFLNNNCYYMLEEAAQFDVHCTHAMTNSFVRGADFIQMANPDFVRAVLLEACATPLDEYHKVIEHQLQNKLNAAYLTGGASFESYLGAIAKLYVFPSSLPLRLAGSGRNYRKKKETTAEEGGVSNLYTATQSNAVQTFVATLTAAEADTQMDEILNMVVNFYKQLDVHFRVVYAPASQLSPAEKLRAIIEIYSSAEQRYVCVGHVSNYGDFVSKRILFASRAANKKYEFPHIIGGPVLYTTRLIAALIDNNISLKNLKLMPSKPETDEKNAIKEFKNMFN